MGVNSPIRYGDFLEGFPAALYRSTLEGTILYCNRTFATLFGYASMHELIGSPEVDLYRSIQTDASVAYVAGVKIVDIEKASRQGSEKSPHD